MIALQAVSTFPGQDHTIGNYFAGTMPSRKRESELRAFQELKADYSEQDIADCLDHVLRVGAPGGQPVHSPMAFLAVGMAEVLGTVSEAREKQRRRDEEDAKRIAREKQEQEAFEREEQERQIRERAFDRAFGEDRQAEVIREICMKHKYPATKGIVGRAFAVAAWWRDLNQTERLEVGA